MSKTDKVWVGFAIAVVALALFFGVKYADGSGDIPVGGNGGSPTPVWDIPEETVQPEIVVDGVEIVELPSTGAGTTAREVQAGFQAGFHHWHFKETRCSYGRLYYVYHAHNVNHYLCSCIPQVNNSWQGYC